MATTAPTLPARFPCWCRAVYSWGGESKRDLGFIEGDLIECLNAGDGQWWVGRLYRDRRSVGSFPSNFVQVLPPDFRPTTRSVSPLPPGGNVPRPSNIPVKPKQKTFRRPFEAYSKAPHYTTAKQPETFREIVKPQKKQRDSSDSSLRKAGSSSPKDDSPPPMALVRAGYGAPRGPSPAPAPALQHRGSVATDRNVSPMSPMPPAPQHHGHPSRAPSPLPPHQQQQQHQHQHQHQQYDYAPRAPSPLPPQQQQQQQQQQYDYAPRAPSPLPPQQQQYDYASRARSPAPPPQQYDMVSRGPSPGPPPQHYGYVSRGPSPAPSFARNPSFSADVGADGPPPPPPPPHRHVTRNGSQDMQASPYDIARHGSNGSYVPYNPYSRSRENSNLSFNNEPEVLSRSGSYDQGYPTRPPTHHAQGPPTPNRPSPGPGSGMTPSPLREAMDGVMEQLDELRGLGEPGDRSAGPTEPHNPWSPESFNMLASPSRQRPPQHGKMAAMSSAGIPSDEGYDTWSAGSSQDPPYQSGEVPDGGDLPPLDDYVHRMENRFSRVHKYSASTPVAASASRDDPGGDAPPPPPPKGQPYERPRSSLGDIFSRGPASPERRLRARKSAYGVVGEGVARTYTTKTNSTEASTGNQSNASGTTQSSARTLWSGASAGAFSSTSAGSMARNAQRPQSAFGLRDAEPERPETPFTGVTYHSSHATEYQSPTRRPKSQAGFHDDAAAGLGGLVQPKAAKRNIFKKIFESARTGVATGRSGIGGSMMGGESRPKSPTRPLTLGGSAMVGMGNNLYMGRESSRDAAAGSDVDWVQVRRDVNRSNSLSQKERTERQERCQMLDHPALNPVDELYDGVEGDEAADGSPVLEPVSYQSINFSQVDKNSRFIAGLPPLTTAVTLATTYVCRPYRSEVQRLRAIFTWVAEKVCWEEDFEGEIDTRQVIQSKRASAKECAVLVMEMCSSIGIRCEVVRGYLKGPGELPDLNLAPRSNHWWNAVIVDDEWRIMDCSLANPSNPRRADYSSASGSSADFWYFLARPLEVCWTHVPEHHDQQHIVPPVAHEILLNLPCASPAFFRQGIEMADYNTSLSRIENLEMVHLKFNVPPEVEVAAEVETRAYSRDADGDVFESGDVIKKRALAQAEWFNGVKRYTVKALLPGDEGQGVLKIYAGQRGLMHSIKDIPHPLALSLPIIHTGENPPYEFVTRHPTPHAQRHDIYVVQPQCQKLALNNTFVFAIRQHPSSSSTSSGPAPPSALTPSSNPGGTSPIPFARPTSAMSMTASISGAGSNPSSASGIVAGKKPAKLAIQTPGGKILRLMRKEDKKGISVGSIRGGADEDASDGGTWETIIKCSEKGTWRGLVLADRTARWCVFAEWVCV
ncbi:Cytokinesis protein 3, contains TGc (transglutaminase/protease-like) domain [Geosmithia morbida]|uniref:Cytokinesis protein 3, contains TGc (Transglutaminase/protease-like) domain n=1 Tax=Geosmithia morbida TaxID=1094350 RepID=A0A9P4YT36_9HYPO|nr:Cytokinesis protein 3, contains TGc (transglutaminase/protease-like) domain [Geosmithia morbida]KAF4120509.1 Cytokinesis protein 3, contains TGc (transglutaminase/protease-like) domain [Geosmithia morbida]